VKWREGDTFLARYDAVDHALRGARPLRVVGERNGYLATWLPPGTMCANPVLDDGRPLRAVTVTERFAHTRTTAIEPWRGQGILMLFPQAAAHSIWTFWKDDGSFWGWYVNLERRHVWDDRGIISRDQVLDLWCERPREWQLKDEDELDDAVEVGFVSEADAAEIRAEGERVALMIEAWEPPFSDGWESWRPDPKWPLPVLPEDWDAK
jgi:hypothetical protein